MNISMSALQKPILAKGEPAILQNEETDNAPAVSLIQSFQPKMSSKSDIDHRLKSVVGKAEKELLALYPADRVLPVIQRLQHVLQDLNYYTHKMSIAIFVSPAEEKVAYLDMPVENKVVIDESFCIRDLVYCKKQDARYLVMQLGAQSSKTYLGQAGDLQLIKSNVSEEKTAPSEFLLRMERGLSIILNAYPFPVFVLGEKGLTGRFSRITHHSGNIAAYIHKDLPDAGQELLLGMLRPYLDDWQKVKESSALRQVENALSAGKLVHGLGAVESMAARKNCRVLVVEKDFKAPDSAKARLDITHFYIRDTVDTIIQKVLENSGDVEFVGNGTLAAHGGIVLVQYY